MKKVLIIGVALVLFAVGYVLAGPFDFASTTGERFRNTVVLELFTVEEIDSAETAYSDWVKIADYNNQKAIFWVNGTTDSTATYQLTLQVSPEKDSSYVANAVIFDSIDSGTRTITALDLTNYAFPWARLKTVRIDTIGVTSTLDVFMGLKYDDVFHIPVYPGQVLGEFLEYDTDDGR